MAQIEKASKETKAKTANKDFSNVTSTLVIFSDPLSDNCYFTQSIWIKYANKYATPQMQFLEVNIKYFDSLARTYGVNLSGEFG